MDWLGCDRGSGGPGGIGLSHSCCCVGTGSLEGISWCGRHKQGIENRAALQQAGSNTYKSGSLASVALYTGVQWLSEVLHEQLPSAACLHTGGVGLMAKMLRA
jgi:hypothetical protein